MCVLHILYVQCECTVYKLENFSLLLSYMMIVQPVRCIEIDVPWDLKGMVVWYLLVVQNSASSIHGIHRITWALYLLTQRIDHLLLFKADGVVQD